MSGPFESETMKGRIEDAITTFLEAVHRPWPEGDPRGTEDRDFVMCLFAEALSRLLIGDSFGVVWEEADRRCGARLRADDPEAVALPPEGLLLLDARLATFTSSAQRYVPLDVVWHHDGGGTVGALTVATISASAVRGRLTVMRDAPGEQDGDWEALCAYLPGLKILYLTLGAVMQARASAEAAAQRLAFDSEVRELVHDRSRDVRDRLEATARLAERLAAGVPTDRLDAVERAVVSVLQELLGAGWGARELSRSADGDPDAREWQLVARIAELVSTSTSSRAAVDPSLRSPEARRLIGTIDAATRSLRWLLDPEGDGQGSGSAWRPAPADVETPDPEAVAGEPLSLLPLWVRMHELARPLAGPRFVGDEARRKVDEVWRMTVERTLPLLARYLEVSRGHSDALRRRRLPRPSARNWMRLWFCLSLLREERAHGQGLLEPERDRLRAELAFALRESLRFSCFGDRRDFFFQASRYASALRLLVEQHAQWVVGLPGDYIRRLLRDIARAGGPNHYLPAEHLQHVLEVYIAGHFMLSVRLVEKGAPGRDMARLLSELDGVTRGDDAARTLRKAWSLAALFHDVGHLLFPDPQPGVNLDDPRIREVLGGVEQGIQGTAKALIAACVRDLGAADYLGDRAIADWFAAHREETEPDHGLLSAWYLLCAGSDEGGGLGEVLAAAVRAVLLHAVVTVPITPKDPLAALLVLCNEVFEWDPRRPASSGTGAVGRSFHVMAAEARREPRDVYLKTLGLTVGVTDGAAGLVEAVIDPAASARGQWPEVQLMLQPPQRLDVPVYSLWLAKAQNLGRIQPVPALGWAPSLLLKSRVDPSLRLRGLTTRSALERVVTAIYGTASIRQWLAERGDFREESRRGGATGPGGRPDARADRELAHLRAGAFPLDPKDVRTLLPRIRREIENLCLQIDATTP